MRYQRRMPQWKTDAARDMRKQPTRAEAALWARIRHRELKEKFRRQACMLGFIADFYCARLRLVIEVDGPIHDEIKDRRRDAIFAKYDIRVIRFTNKQVLTDIDGVLLCIWAEVQMRQSIAPITPSLNRSERTRRQVLPQM